MANCQCYIIIAGALTRKKHFNVPKKIRLPSLQQKKIQTTPFLTPSLQLYISVQSLKTQCIPCKMIKYSLPGNQTVIVDVHSHIFNAPAPQFCLLSFIFQLECSPLPALGFASTPASIRLIQWTKEEDKQKVFRCQIRLSPSSLRPVPSDVLLYILLMPRWHLHLRHEC